MNPALIAAFKSKTTALIDTLHLPAETVVGLGLTLAVAHAAVITIPAGTLHQLLDAAIADRDKALAEGRSA